MGWMRTAIITAVISVTFGLTQDTFPDPSTVHEYDLKAAFLSNFARFVQWPEDVSESPPSPIIIGVLGKDPFGDALDAAVEGKTIHGRSLIIKRFRTLKDVEECHILYISHSEKKRLPLILKGLEDTSMLTVGDTGHFAHLGGMIRFFREEDRIRLEINLDAAEKEGLKLSSNLLNLARIMREPPEGRKHKE